MGWVGVQATPRGVAAGCPWPGDPLPPPPAAEGHWQLLAFLQHTPQEKGYSSCPTGGGTVSKLLKDLSDARPKVAENAAPSVTPARPWAGLSSSPSLTSLPRQLCRWSEAPSPMLCQGQARRGGTQAYSQRGV